MSTYVEWRLYVGPHYLDYNWSVHHYNAADDLAVYATTLSTGIGATATSLTTANGTAFPFVGGLWVGPKATGQGWEYIKYTARSGSTFSGLTREPANERGHNGVHSVTAAVQLFVKITGNNGTLQFDGEMDDQTKAVVTWSASTGGSRYQQVLRNGHLVIVQKRHARTGAFTNALVGFINEPEVTDDANRRSEWTLPIVSVAGLLATIRAAGVRAGDFNAAATGSASASDVLTSFPLIYEERGSGDFSAAYPELDAAKAIDNVANTLWIGERYLGIDNLPATGINNGDTRNNGFVRFSQIYVNPAPGTRSGARWFEVVACQGGGFDNCAVFAANGGTGYATWLFGGPGVVETGAITIFCEDKGVFEELYPNAQYVAIYENAAFFQNLPAAGGELWLRFGLVNNWTSRVAWGNANGYINHPDAPGQSYTPLNAPGPGQNLRYIFNPSPTPANYRGYWKIEAISHPGWELDEDNESWFIANLPGMGLRLGRSLAAGDNLTNVWLPIIDEADNKNTGPLDESGILQIGSEQFAYSQKSFRGVFVSQRAYGGTSATAHASGDPIYVVDGGLATDAQSISKLVLSWHGSIIGKSLLMYTSNLPTDPRTPDDANWLADWVGFNTLTNNTLATHISFISPAKRIKHILIKFKSMNVAPARARLSELKAILNETLYGTNAALPDGTTAGAIIQQILVNAGIPVGAITHSGTPALTDVQTAADYAWAVVADIADFAGLRIVVGRDSKISIATSSLWAGAQAATQTWTSTNAKRVKHSWRNGAAVSQVKIRWRNASNTQSGVEAFPEEPDTTGSPVELDEMIYATATAAQTAAQRRYYAARFPDTSLVECAGNEWDRYAGEVHALDWKADMGGGTINRVCVAARVTHRFEKRIATSAVELAAIQHTSNN